ncbi:MAG: hypothetical protein QOH87_1174 [Trebonia sp.]|nr:hypothetical protein [Trebonia sp.]
MFGADAAHMRVRLVITVTLVAGGLCGSAQADQSMSADQANTVARAINLAAGDLPGYTGSPNVTTADARREQARMFRCAGVLPRSRAVVDVDSQAFRMAGSGSGEPALRVVASHVTVMPSAASARRDLAALASARGRACQVHYNAVSSPHIRILDVSIIKLPAPTSGGYWLRMKIHQRANGRRMTLLADAFMFRRGPVEVTLATVSTAHSFSSGEQRRLITLLLTRAEQQLPQAS